MASVPMEHGSFSPAQQKEKRKKGAQNNSSAKHRKAKAKKNKTNSTFKFSYALPAKTGRNIRCLHQNANGLRARLRDGSFFKTLESEKPDVVAITESRCTRKQFLKFRNTRTHLKQLGYHYTAFNVTHSNVGYAGVAILSKLPFATVELGLDCAKTPPHHKRLLAEMQQEARVLIAEFGHFNLAVVYSPNSGKPGDLARLPKRRAFEELLRQRLSQVDMPCLLVGDLNTVRRPNDASDGLQHARYIDHPGCTVEERALLEQMIEDNHFVDLQEQHGVPGHTYNNSRGYSLRLDYVLVHSAIETYVRDFKHVLGMASDHTGQTFCVDESLFNIAPQPFIRATELSADTILQQANALQSQTAQDIQASCTKLLAEADSISDLNPVVQSLQFEDVQLDDDEQLSVHELLAALTLDELEAVDTDRSGQISLHQLEDLLSKKCVISEDSTYQENTECCTNVQYIETPSYVTEQPRKVSLITIDLNMVECLMGGPNSTIAKMIPLRPMRNLKNEDVFPFKGIGDSGCSTSCVSYRALCAVYGKAAVDKALYKGGYNPIFQIADGTHVASLGQLKMRFVIGGVPFWHVFYALPTLAHDFIFGNNFLEQTNASIDYRRGHLTIYNALNQPAQVPFGVKSADQALNALEVLPQRESTLFAASDVHIPAFSSMYVLVKPRASDTLCTEKPFGIVGPHWMSKKVQTPFGITKLRCEGNTLLLSNFTSLPVRVGRGSPVALFLEVARGDVDLYAANLSDMSLFNLGAVQSCACAHCLTDTAEALNHASPVFQQSDSKPRDKFTPFEGVDDEHLAHLPRFTEAQVSEMTDEEIEKLFADTFLKDSRFGKTLAKKQIKEMKEILLLNRDVFGKNACPGLANHAGVQIHTGDALPTGFPLRPTMPKLRPIIDQHLDIMLKHQIISPSDSPWGAAVLMVPKKGGEFRFAIDYRRLNAVTTKDAYPLPRIDDALASLAGNKYFTACDALAGFWNLPMGDEESKQKTAFRCHRGSFQFNRLPFGLVNAPAAFQRYMDIAMVGLNFTCALVYLDDILVFSKTWEDHKRDLTAVFECVRKAGLHLKLKKCTFGANSVDYLGHVICEEGVRPSPIKTAVIDEFKIDGDDPKEARKRIRSWLGLASYYRKYVPHFASLTEPLQKFIHSRKQYTGMTNKMQAAINVVKDALTSEPILAHPDFAKPFEIHCDASPYAIGGTLVQRDALGERVVMYISRSLKKHERNYHHYEKEALALFWCVTVFRPYVLGVRFKVVTDNRALLALFKKDPEHRMIRWVLALQQYDIEYLFRAGSKHGDADGLSRAFKVPSWVSFGKDDNIEALYSVMETWSKKMDACYINLDTAHTLDDVPRDENAWAKTALRRIQTHYQEQGCRALLIANLDAVMEKLPNTSEKNAEVSTTAAAQCNSIIEDRTQKGRILNVDLPSRAELVVAQKEDVYLNRIRENLLKGESVACDKSKFFLKDDVLFRQAHINTLFLKRKKCAIAIKQHKFVFQATFDALFCTVCMGWKSADMMGSHAHNCALPATSGGPQLTKIAKHGSGVVYTANVVRKDDLGGMAWVGPCRHNNLSN